MLYFQKSWLAGQWKRNTRLSRISKHFIIVTCATIQSRSLFNCITTRIAAKGIKNQINAVDGQGLIKNYDRKIQGQTNCKITFVMLKKMSENELCDVMVRSSKPTKLSFQHQVSSSRNYMWIKKIIIHWYSLEEYRNLFACYIHLHWRNKTWKKPGGAFN